MVQRCVKERHSSSFQAGHSGSSSSTAHAAEGLLPSPPHTSDPVTANGGKQEVAISSLDIFLDVHNIITNKRHERQKTIPFIKSYKT